MLWEQQPLTWGTFFYCQVEPMWAEVCSLLTSHQRAVGNFLSATILSLSTYAESNFMSPYKTPCAQNQPNLAIFYEDALFCTSVSNFFPLGLPFLTGHLLWVLSKISSLPRIGCEVYICNLAREWCRVKMNLLYRMLWAQAKIIYDAMLVSSESICSLTGMFILSQLWVTLTVFQAPSGYMWYWEMRSDNSQLVFWTWEVPHRQC